MLDGQDLLQLLKTPRDPIGLIFFFRLLRFINFNLLFFCLINIIIIFVIGDRRDFKSSLAGTSEDLRL